MSEMYAKISKRRILFLRGSQVTVKKSLPRTLSEESVQTKTFQERQQSRSEQVIVYDYEDILSQESSIISMGGIQIKGIIEVIDEAIDELIILGEVTDAPKVEANIEYVELEDRFDLDAADETLFDPITIQPLDEAYLKQGDYSKFQYERTWLQNVLETVVEKSDLEKILKSLQDILNDYDKTINDEKFIYDTNRKYETLLRELEDAIQIEKADIVKEIRNKDKEIGNLKDEMEDLLAESKIKVRYIGDWENCRVEKNHTRHDRKETSLKETIKYYSREIDKEERIHGEIQNYLSIAEVDLKAEIENWVSKYDTDLEDLENRITVLAAEKDRQTEDLIDLKAEYDKRQKDMAEYLAYKEVKRLEAEELKRRHIAATKIQAWWRGTMFRKGLGPYRKKKKKKGKGSAKGSGKGKKSGSAKGKGSGKGKKKK